MIKTDKNKKLTDSLNTIGKLLDEVLTIITKLTLIEMAIKTMIQIWKYL